MLKRKLLLIFVVLLSVENASTVKICSSWLDYWNFVGANSCRQTLDAEDEFVPIVSRWGKRVEIHEIITYDGYILTLFRILSDQENASPVLLLHGIFMNSLAFVNRGQKSLAYQFVDKGYDVWILNWRGTKYSRSHISHKAYEGAFWKFSLHELAIYDLPKALEEIKKSNDQKILIVGFQIGNSAALMYASLYPDKAEDCISGIVSLSPTGAPIQVNILTKMMFYGYYAAMKHMFRILYHDEVPAILQNFRATVFCRRSGIWFARFCDVYFMMTTGLDTMQQDPETLPQIVFQNHDSNSLMTFLHLSQMMMSRKFQQFDYGEKRNLVKYGKKEPPEYDLSKISVPQIFIVGKNDKAGTLQDATVMYQHIRTEYQREFYVIEHEKFGLSDFVQAKDINDFLHVHLMECVMDLAPPVSSN